MRLTQLLSGLQDEGYSQFCGCRRGCGSVSRPAGTESRCVSRVSSCRLSFTHPTALSLVLLSAFFRTCAAQTSSCRSVLHAHIIYRYRQPARRPIRGRPAPGEPPPHPAPPAPPPPPPQQRCRKTQRSSNEGGARGTRMT